MPKSKSSKSKGKGLTKKVGPLPVYAYLIGVAIVVFYLYYRRRNSNGGSSSVAGSQNQQIIPSGIVVPQTQGISSQDNSQGGYSNPAPTDSSPLYFPSDYATETDLANAVNDVKNNTAASIAAITFPQPNINITVPKTSVSSTTTASKTAAKKAASTPKKITYYTYKKNVPLKAGQTLHFTKGKGYYAA